MARRSVSRNLFLYLNELDHNSISAIFSDDREVFRTAIQTPESASRIDPINSGSEFHPLQLGGISRDGYAND